MHTSADCLLSLLLKKKQRKFTSFENYLYILYIIYRKTNYARVRVLCWILIIGSAKGTGGTRQKKHTLSFFTLESTQRLRACLRNEEIGINSERYTERYATTARFKRHILFSLSFLIHWLDAPNYKRDRILNEKL